MLSYQRRYNISETFPLDEKQFWAIIRDPHTKYNVDMFRETGEDKYKKALAGILFQANFMETPSEKKGIIRRWRKQKATCLTGLAVIDVDHIADPRAEFRRMQANYDFTDYGILFAMVSPSGYGLKVVFKCDPEVGNIADNLAVMAERLGIPFDGSGKDATRLCFVCPESEILYLNKELFTYENEKFAEKFNESYRSGNTGFTCDHNNVISVDDGKRTREAVRAAAKAESVDSTDTSNISYAGVKYEDIINQWLGGKEPKQGDRHNTLLTLAYQLRYITDDDPKLIERICRQLPFVQDIEKRGEDVKQSVKDACSWEYKKYLPKRMSVALKKSGIEYSSAFSLKEINEATESKDDFTALPYDQWGEQIKGMFDDFPCLKEACADLAPAAYPAVLFTAGAFLGTLMTRTWYYFYHRPEERRRLNYCIYIIGDPASGKSFATRLFRLLVAPINAKDQVGVDALNRYKKESKERTTSSKAQKGEALKKPEPIIRVHPARTSNMAFIEDMNNAVEIIDGEPVHLHMLTFDSELDNATLNMKGGSWIDKTSMELKSFHNEEDGQYYGNNESVMTKFNVYWNYVYTGTPLALNRKVTARNFGSGLSTRLGVVMMPPTGFKMLELKRVRKIDHVADETLKAWAYKLDEVKGELPLWPLVELTYDWASLHMELAGEENSKAEELLVKRVPYYGICLAAPFVLMRHWEEWKEKQTFTIDNKDKALCNLILNIQYANQKYFFGKYAQSYFDNQKVEQAATNSYQSKYQVAWEGLPEEFTLEQAQKAFGHDSRANTSTFCARLQKRGVAKRLKQGVFKKLSNIL